MKMYSFLLFQAQKSTPKEQGGSWNILIRSSLFLFRLKCATKGVCLVLKISYEYVKFDQDFSSRQESCKSCGYSGTLSSQADQ